MNIRSNIHYIELGLPPINTPVMNFELPNRNDHLRRLSDIERQQVLQELKQTLDWIDEYEEKDPFLRSYEEIVMYKQKSLRSATISRQLMQHALIGLHQLAYMLTDAMEVIEIAMEIDPRDKKKYHAFRELRKTYVKFMKAFKRDFRNN